MDYSTKVYDKAKYHFESIEKDGLNEIQAYVHTAFYWRWILDNDFIDPHFREDFMEDFEAYKSGEISALRFYEIVDGCLIGDMMNEEGNQFSSHYFDFQTGQYLKDYMGLLANGMKSAFAVVYSDENYERLKPYIDRAYRAWKRPRPWWQFW